MSEYDLKNKTVGQLYPILKDKHGNVIDGFHRLEADPEWRQETLENIDTEEKLLVARAVANWHRRQVNRKEKEEWINRLAKIYQKQGLEIYGKGKGTPNEIIEHLVKSTGLSQVTINKHLFNKFKQKDPPQLEGTTRVLASQRIKIALGEDVVERHRDEIKADLITDPDFVTGVIATTPITPDEVEIIRELPSLNDRKAVVKETIEYGLKKDEVRMRVNDIKRSRRQHIQPNIGRRTIIQGDWLVQRITKPAGELLSINIDAFNELSLPQQDRIYDLLTTLRNKIDEMIQWYKR